MIRDPPAPLVPDGARVEFLEHRGGRVRLLRGGPAAADGAVPLVLVHGGGPDHAGISWSPVFAALARDRAVLAFDLPGSGATTGVPIDGRPTALADLAVAVARAAGVPRAVWAGVSMGGDVVLNVALRHPGAVAGLVLVAPAGLVARAGSRVLHPFAWLVTRLPDPVLRPLVRCANRFTGAALRAAVHAPDGMPSHLRDAVVREARRPDAALGYLRYNQATLGPWRMRNDLTSRVGEIDAPALLLHGRHDRLVPLRGSVVAAATMRRARLVPVDGCGHWVQVERPGTFLTEVAHFLRTLPV